jgi:hypothetical protein
VDPWSWVGSFVRDALEQGWSQRHTLEVGREAGMLPRDSVFRDVWHAEVESRRKAADLADLPGQSQIPDALHVEWGVGRAGEYRYNMHMQVFDTETGEVRTQWHTVTNSTPLTPNEAEGQALDDYDHELGPDTPQGNVMGATLVGAYLMTGKSL